MQLTKEVLAAIKAHNARKGPACANEDYNRTYNLGTARARHLVSYAVRSKYGYCDGPTNLRRCTKEMVEHAIIGCIGSQFDWGKES